MVRGQCRLRRSSCPPGRSAWGVGLAAIARTRSRRRWRRAAGRLAAPRAVGLPPRSARDCVRSGRRRRAGLRPVANARTVARVSIALRRLAALADLDAIERIERASYPTPWSRSMFASVCKAEVRDRSPLSQVPVSRRISRVVALRRCLARHERRRRPGPQEAGHRLGDAPPPVRLTRDDAERGYTLEVRVSNLAAISLYEQFGFTSSGVRRGYYTTTEKMR